MKPKAGSTRNVAVPRLTIVVTAILPASVQAVVGRCSDCGRGKFIGDESNAPLK
jgi:hypothetical protein